MSKPCLIFYDTSQAYSASYYLSGFNELRKTHGLQMRVAQSLPARLKSAIQNADWQHLLFSMVVFQLRQDDKTWFFCIDTHDDSSVNIENHTGGYHWPLLQCVDAYFKVNLNPQIVKQTPALNAFREKIHSIAQFFPLRSPFPLALCRRLILPSAWFGYTPSLGYSQSYNGHFSAAKHRLRDLKNFLLLDQIVAYRNAPKDIDIFYVTSFRHNPRHESVMEQRCQIMNKLACIPHLNAVIGFTSHKTLPEKYIHRSHRRLNQSEYLETLSRSRIVIYTQGMEGCISSKFGLAMALGIAAMGEPLANNPELLITYPHLIEQFGFTDSDELVNRTLKLASDSQKAHQLGTLNASMFDNSLAPRPTAEYILHTLQKL